MSEVTVLDGEDYGVEIPDAVALNGGCVQIFRNRSIVDLVVMDEDHDDLGGVSLNIDDLLEALRKLEVIA